MTARRRVLLGLGAAALAAPFASIAQPAPGKVVRIGILGPTDAASFARTGRQEALLAGLREAGYVEGRNLDIEYRWAAGKDERFDPLAAELVALKVDVIVTNGAPGPFAAKRATSTIPIVLAPAGDVVGLGLVSNLARPGGNITGSIFFVNELNAKRLELLKRTLPRITQVGVLAVRNAHSTPGLMKAMEQTAASLKIALRTFEVSVPGDFEGAFAAMARNRMQAAVIHDMPLLDAGAKAIAGIASAKRIPSIGFGGYADAGGLFSYGVDFPAMWRRVGYFVDKIVKGTRPGDIAIEQSSRFELAVNLKTAKALGIKLPQSILLQATKVIE